jgi:hypothetical protein
MVAFMDFWVLVGGAAAAAAAAAAGFLSGRQAASQKNNKQITGMAGRQLFRTSMFFQFPGSWLQTGRCKKNVKRIT